MSKTSATFHGCYFNAEDERITQELRSKAKNARIDLDVFLALKGEARAERWQQWDRATKIDAVIQMMTRLGMEWDEAAVAAWVAKYDEKWGPTIETDLNIPAVSEIADVAKEHADLARRHGDYASARQLDRVRMNVINGARLVWHLGDLLIQSVNHPGEVYSVSRTGCTCPNGAAGKAQCWHVALFDILLDMQQTTADTADMEADAAERAEAARQLGARACAVRSGYLVAA